MFFDNNFFVALYGSEMKKIFQQQTKVGASDSEEKKK